MFVKIAEFTIVGNIASAGSGNQKLLAGRFVFFKHQNTLVYTLNSSKQTGRTSTYYYNVSSFQNNLIRLRDLQKYRERTNFGIRKNSIRFY